MCKTRKGLDIFILCAIMFMLDVLYNRQNFGGAFMNFHNLGTPQPSSHYTNDRGFFMLKFFKSLFRKFGKNKKLSVEEILKIISTLVPHGEYEKLVAQLTGCAEEEVRDKISAWIGKSDDPEVKKLLKKI